MIWQSPRLSADLRLGQFGLLGTTLKGVLAKANHDGIMSKTLKSLKSLKSAPSCCCSQVSCVKISALSGMPLAFCVFVPETCRHCEAVKVFGSKCSKKSALSTQIPPAPLIPEVALVLLPPQKEDLSKSTTRPPFSTTVFAADIPALPRPTGTADRTRPF